jgi:predicted nuclease of predicted toxin-antitoxin system
VRFLVDAQLPPALVDRLMEKGHEAEHVHAIALGVAADAEIWAYAVKAKAVLVTKDQDFADLTLDDRHANAVVWVRLGNTTNAALWRSLEPLLPEIIEALSRGERLIEIT